jgi:integrase
MYNISNKIEQNTLLKEVLFMKKAKSGAYGNGSITERKNANGKTYYTVRYKEYCTTVKDYAKARIKLDELRERDRLGLRINPHAPKQEETLLTAIENMITDKAQNVKPTTIERYRQVTKQYIEPEFISYLQVSTVTRKDIDQWVRGLQRKGLSKNTIHIAFGVINQTFKGFMFANPDKIKQNPCYEYEIKETNSEKEKKAAKGERVYTKEELDKLMQAAKRSKHKDVLVMLITTGMRVGEVLFLKWDAVDFENKQLTVYGTCERTNGKMIDSNTPKTKSGNRTIPMTDECFDLLKRLYREREDHTRVFHYRDTDEPVPYQNVYMCVRYACKKAGIEVPSKLHSLRHTFATRCHEYGVDTLTLSNIMGHKNTSTTEEVYTAVTDEQKQREVQKIPRFTIGK